MSKSYSELIAIPSFEERYRYLRISGTIGIETFGFDRYLNQALYRDGYWKEIRRKIIIRDEGCDLAFPGREIPGRIIIHHLNPLTEKDLLNRSDKIFDPENLITTCIRTHNAIHYGDESLLYQDPIERKENDTIPWR